MFEQGIKGPPRRQNNKQINVGWVGQGEIAERDRDPEDARPPKHTQTLRILSRSQEVLFGDWVSTSSAY